MTATAPIAFFWGDDDLAAARAVGRMAAAIAETAGGPVERLDVRGDRNLAAHVIGGLHERVATASMFGGGTLAVVTNVGALTVRTEDRAALLAILPLVAPGSGIVFVEATTSGSKEPGQKRVVDAVRAVGGEVRAFRAPKAGELAGWIEAEARERGVSLAPGAARELASRVGGYVLDNDADRRTQTQLTAHELDKLALFRPDTPISVEDVRALVPEAVPGSVWAFTDAVGLRDASRAVGLLERLLGTQPEPVLLAVLHRRIRELIEVADHLASGVREETLPRQLGLHPFRVQQLATQARRWSIDDLRAALDGLVELDATVKGAPGSPGSEAQRRLGFTLWLSDNLVRAGAAGSANLVGRAPGLLLDDEIALDGEDAAALAQVEQVDQVRIDVELVAVLAKPTRDAETEPLAPIGHSERRVETRRDEAASAAGAALSEAGHRLNVDLGTGRASDRPLTRC